MGNATQFEKSVLCFGTFHIVKNSLAAFGNIYKIIVQKTYLENSILRCFKGVRQWKDWGGCHSSKHY